MLINKAQFTDVYTYVKGWVQSNQVQWEKQGVKADIANDDTEALIVDLDFEHCMGQIIVDNPGFAPYKYFFYEALALDSAKTNLYGRDLIYFYYDSEDTTIDELYRILDEILIYCKEYTPDCLLHKYKHREGNVNSTIPYLDIVHPDDLEIYAKVDATHDRFRCVDTFAQYLVLENGNVSIRVKWYGFDCD